MAEHLGIFCRMNAGVKFTSGAALCGQMNQKINFLKNKISCLYTRSLINSSCAWTVDWISHASAGWLVHLLNVLQSVTELKESCSLSLSLSQIRSLYNFIQEVSEWVTEASTLLLFILYFSSRLADIHWGKCNNVENQMRGMCVGWWAGSEAPALWGYHIPQSASYFRPPSSSIRSFPTCTKRPSSNTHGLMWLSSQPFGVPATRLR